MSLNVALAGAGAFGLKHLDAIKAIDGANVISVVDRERGKTEEVARRYGISHVTVDLAESLAMKQVDAVACSRRSNPIGGAAGGPGPPSLGAARKFGVGRRGLAIFAQIRGAGTS